MRMLVRLTPASLRESDTGCIAVLPLCLLPPRPRPRPRPPRVLRQRPLPALLRLETLLLPCRGGRDTMVLLAGRTAPLLLRRVPPRPRPRPPPRVERRPLLPVRADDKVMADVAVMAVEPE